MRLPAPADSTTDIDLLTQTVEDISGVLALQPLLERIVERACVLIGANDGLIGLYEPDNDLVRVAATYRLPADQVPLGSEARRGQGLTGLVLERDAPVRCRYGDLPNPLNRDALDNDVIGMPIRDRGRLIGVFGICAIPPNRMIDDAEARLAQLARHAAVAIQNARRYSEEQRRAARFALIARIAGIIASAPELDSLLQRAADAIHELLEYQNVDIPLIEADDPLSLVIRIRGGDYKRRIRHVDRIPLGEGIMGAAAAQRQAQLVNDVDADPRYIKPPNVRAPRAELAMPILHRDELLGVLNVEGDHAFDELDRISLEIVAEHLGVAIVNARLVERSKQAALLEERQRLARDLHDNVTQILSSMSLISQSLMEAWQRDPAEGERRVKRLGELSRLALAEMRDLLQELSPRNIKSRNLLPLERTSFPERLRRLLSPMVPANVLLHIDVDEFQAQAEAHEEAVLRVCQEAVSNAVRHAAPTSIEIGTLLTSARLCISISDNGLGMPLKMRQGMGLSNMHERLAELGGELQISARIPHGTKVVASLPRFDRIAK